jgi:chitinase
LNIGGNVLHFDISSFLAFLNKVVSYFDMLAPLMVNRILDKGNDGFIIENYADWISKTW